MSYNDYSSQSNDKRYNLTDSQPSTYPASGSSTSSSLPLTFPEFDHVLGIGPSTFGQVHFQMPQFILGGPPSIPPGGGAEAMTSMLPHPDSDFSPLNNWFVNDFMKGEDAFRNLSPREQVISPTTMFRHPSDEARFLDFSAARTPSDNGGAYPVKHSPSGSRSPPTSEDVKCAMTYLKSSQFNPTHPINPTTVGIPSNVQPLLYSATGFDVLAILSKVATRPKPKIVLGPVDFTCSFCFVDVRRFNHPIVYASPTFYKLTGYAEHEVLGTNCRFLQNPSGKVDKGSERKFTSPDAVNHLKKSLLANKECQASLINYRKGGQAFINLVTVIPIPADDSDEIAYHVGFQVDLTEQPNAILQRLNDGSYIVNYGNSTSTSYPGTGPDRLRLISQDLRRIVTDGRPSPVVKAGQDSTDLNKFLLENLDDFIHVVSLKGLFQYVSPSVRNVLEYEADELIGKSMADICHPADITPVIRELKDSSSTVPLAPDAPPGAQPSLKTISLLFRARAKRSGYVWIEAHGRLHVEPGKGRKSIVLCGRLRSIPRISWSTVSRAGGISNREFWGALSSHGLWLNVSPQVSSFLGRSADDLCSTSILDMLPRVNDKNHVLQVLREASKPNPSTNIFEVMVELQTAGGKPPRLAHLLFYSRENDNSNMFSSSLRFTPAPIVIQVRLAPTSSEEPQNASLLPIPAHSLPKVGNIFEELDTTRHTSWQYELTHLKIANKTLMATVAQLESELGILPTTAFQQASSSISATTSNSPPLTPFNKRDAKSMLEG